MENENMVKVYRLKMLTREIDQTFLQITQIGKPKTMRSLIDFAVSNEIQPSEEYLANLKADLIAVLTKRQEAGYAKLKEMGVELDNVVLLPDEEDSVPNVLNNTNP